jgi:hypothetical protein
LVASKSGIIDQQTEVVAVATQLAAAKTAIDRIPTATQEAENAAEEAKFPISIFTVNGTVPNGAVLGWQSPDHSHPVDAGLNAGEKSLQVAVPYAMGAEIHDLNVSLANYTKETLALKMNIYIPDISQFVYVSGALMCRITTNNGQKFFEFNAGDYTKFSQGWNRVTFKLAAASDWSNVAGSTVSLIQIQFGVGNLAILLNDIKFVSSTLPAGVSVEAILPAARVNAKAELNAYYNGNVVGDYRAAQQTVIADVKTAGNAAIDAAETPADVAAALNTAKAVINAVKTDAELLAEEALATAKTNAKTELNAYKNAVLNDYRDAQKNAITAAKTAGGAAIDEAADTAGVTSALTAAKGVIDAIKTDAQLTQELTAEKTGAKTELAAYKSADIYRDTQKTELTDAIAAGNTAIDAASDTAGITAALNAAKGAIDAIKTDAQLTEEENANPGGGGCGSGAIGVLAALAGLAAIVLLKKKR